MVDTNIINGILTSQIIANQDKLTELQAKHFMEYQEAAQKYISEHSSDPQESVNKHIAEMQVKAMSQACLDTFSLGIQTGIHAVMDLGETILNNGIKNIN